MSAEAKPPQKPRGRGLLLGVAVLSIAVVLLLPAIVSKTPLPNIMLNRALAKRQMSGHVGDLRLGWLSPVTAKEVSLQRDDGRLQTELAGVELDRSWIGTVMGLPDLGRVVLQAPEIDIRINSKPPYWQPVPTEGEAPSVTGEVVVEDGSLRIHADESPTPLFQIQNVNLTARIVENDAGRQLEIEPVALLSEQELRPELFDQGLQLFAPVLAKSTEVSGTVSLYLDQFELPVGGSSERLSEGEVRGTLELHHVSASLKDAPVVEVVSQLARLFQIDLPNGLRLVDDTVVDFELRDGRIHQQGLAFLIPEISPELMWRTSGSVGLDETLDLLVEVKLPFGDLPDAPLLSSLTRAPLRFRVQGTIDQPRVSPLANGDLLQNLGVSVLEALQRRREMRRQESPDRERPRRRLLRRRE